MQAALGLGMDGLPAVNSSAGSRLWKWSGRSVADDAPQFAGSTTGDGVATKTFQNDGAYLCMLVSCKSRWLGSRAISHRGLFVGPISWLHT